MSQALCLNCGELKFGAFCPCPLCNAAATGNVDLDLAFSDHKIPEDTLRKLGDFLKIIRFRSGDDDLTFWVFLFYISCEHPHILKIELPRSMYPAVLALYITLPWPDIRIDSGNS
ncbi:hypothetical protein BH09VER1_BH09VER1_17840 [soil metagenome]